MTRTNEAGETRASRAAGAKTPAGDAQPVYPHTMRLQRFLARAGVASRRGSEGPMDPRPGAKGPRPRRT